MSMSAQEYYQAGRLDEAIEAMNAEVKSNPSDPNRRGFLAELLCFKGNLERADLMLDLIADHDPTSAVGIALFRQLVRAAQARQQLFSAGRVPEFLGEPPPYLKLHLEATIAVREGNHADAARLLGEAEVLRPQLSVEMNGKTYQDIRDIDDLTASFFEVASSTGKYFWIEMERIESIVFEAPKRPRDLIWRQAAISVSQGPDGAVYIPAIYETPSEDLDAAFRLGRQTDWTGPEGGPIRGLGQRSYLIGDELVPIMEIQTLTFPPRG